MCTLNSSMKLPRFLLLCHKNTLIIYLFQKIIMCQTQTNDNTTNKTTLYIATLPSRVLSFLILKFYPDMRQYRPTKNVSWLLLLLSFFVLVVVASQAEAGHDQEQGMNSKNPSKWKLLSSPPSLTVAAYCEAIKNKYSTLAAAPLSFLSPPKPNTE